ncbi:hypothetical protein FVE85_8447 [Porphyridium purpureum]|uniref:BZIP domain-containing protein n=1 Tax=Porphyridium purpureum TaxID=35688 RepID=A0A5J4YLE6_PORPP|nr:hypothetical protein FVE85_8447 [Porphyridium purpureum]|eukprot:POR9501..scf244_11
MMAQNPNQSWKKRAREKEETAALLLEMDDEEAAAAALQQIPMMHQALASPREELPPVPGLQPTGTSADVSELLSTDAPNPDRAGPSTYTLAPHPRAHSQNHATDDFSAQYKAEGRQPTSEATSLGLACSSSNPNLHGTAASSRNGEDSDDEEMRKVKAELELLEKRVDPKELGDLSGTTSAMSRKMTKEEHDLMLYKRKLRNRLSAARSRKRHQETLASLQTEIESLNEHSNRVMAKCEEASTENTKLREENMRLYCENMNLRSRLSALNGAINPQQISVGAVGASVEPAPTGVPGGAGQVPNTSGNAALPTGGHGLDREAPPRGGDAAVRGPTNGAAEKTRGKKPAKRAVGE